MGSEAIDIPGHPGADIAVGQGDYNLQPGVSAVRKGALDIARARDELGYEPTFDIRKGLEAYIAAEFAARADRA